MTAILAALVILCLQPWLKIPLLVYSLITSSPPNSLPVPVVGVKPSQIANTWGAPRSGGRVHKGIDIFAKRFTPILSTTDGVIIKSGNNLLGGRVIAVLGPGGQIHYYAHLEKYGNLRRFDWVWRGDLIGYVGNSGNARHTPPHLHYGIYTYANKAINPFPLFMAEDTESRASSSQNSDLPSVSLPVMNAPPFCKLPGTGRNNVGA